MKFEEIFLSDGLYVADGFAPGVCFKVGGGILKLVTYKDGDDLLPSEENALMYAGLLKKEYKKVFTRQSLFEK